MADRPRLPGTALVTVDLRGGTAPAAGSCVAADPAAWAAYAIIAGRTPATLSGSAFLIDPNGWLRAVWQPDTAALSGFAGQVAAALRRMIANPIEPHEGGTHVHTP